MDTSNEIGGDGDVPHPAIGGARRMQVPDPSQQHRVMVRAVALMCSCMSSVGTLQLIEQSFECAIALAGHMSTDMDHALPGGGCREPHARNRHSG